MYRCLAHTQARFANEKKDKLAYVDKICVRLSELVYMDSQTGRKKTPIYDETTETNAMHDENSKKRKVNRILCMICSLKHVIKWRDIVTFILHVCFMQLTVIYFQKKKNRILFNIVS